MRAQRRRAERLAASIVGVRTVVVCCVRHARRPRHGVTCIHGRGEGGRAAAVYSRRVGECGVLRPCDVVGKRRICRIISLSRTASGGRGGRPSTPALDIRTGAYRRPWSSKAKGTPTRSERFV
eukprot:2835818-Pleurochrysis_carterae.AAC.1